MKDLVLWPLEKRHSWATPFAVVGYDEVTPPLLALTTIEWLELIGGVLALIGLLTLSGYVIVQARKWRNTEQPSLEQQLQHYQALRDQGLLDPAEFERIRNALTGASSADPPTPPT